MSDLKTIHVRRFLIALTAAVALCLAAGSVSHAAHHTFDMRKMGGLKKYMPATFWTFAIGTLALMGLFPLAGFWSKDEILAGSGQFGYKFALIMGGIGAFLTCAYMTRVLTTPSGARPAGGRNISRSASPCRKPISPRLGPSARRS